MEQGRANQYYYTGESATKVTLVRPPMVTKAAALNISSITPPLALASLSAVLRHNKISVTNIDGIGEAMDQSYRLKRDSTMIAQGLTHEEIVARIPSDTTLVGVSCMFSIEWPNTRDLIAEIRQAFPEALIVGGGEHFTALPDLSLKQCEALDLIILGEGEETLLELIQRLEVGRDYSDLPLKKRNHQPQLNSSVLDGVSGQRVRELDELPWPAWDLTPINEYLKSKRSFGMYAGVTMPIMGSRGCPYDCTFCSNPLMWGRRYLTRTASDVVDEIAHYKEKYGIEAVEFYDLTAIVKKSWIIEFCNQLIDRKINIKWQISGGTRCEAIDEEVISKAKEAGCMYLCFAPESGNRAVLKRIRKKVDIDRMLDLIRISVRHKLQTRCNLIIGFPDETRREILSTLLFNMKLAFMGVADSPIFEFSPYPGTVLFNQLRQDDVIGELDDEYFENLGANLQLKDRKRYCREVSPFEIYLYRTLGMSMFYGLYYLFRPIRFLQFMGNLINYRYSRSVFEQRIIENFQTKFKRA